MNTPSPHPEPRFRPADSPWFWAFAFCSMALVGIAAIGPKFAQRQSRLENRHAGRERAAAERSRRGAGLAPVDLADDAREPVVDAEPQRVVIWPLAVACGAAALGSAAMLARDLRRARSSR